MRHTLPLLAVALASALTPALGAETFDVVTEENLREYVKSSLEDIEEARLKMREQIRAAERGRVSRVATRDVVTFKTRSGFRFAYKTEEAKQETVEKYKQGFERLNKNASSLLPVLPFGSAMETGQIGYLGFGGGPWPDFSRPGGVPDPNNRFWVQQVIDSGNALIRWHRFRASRVVPEQPGQPERFRPLTTDKIDKEMIFWYSGSTDGMVDDSTAELEGVYSVTGTRQYDTAGGSTNTVHVIEKYDVTKLLEEVKAEAQAKPDDQPDDDEFLTWTDSTGQFEVTARFKSLANNVVSLEKEDGTTIQVPLERLSSDGQERVEAKR